MVAGWPARHRGLRLPATGRVFQRLLRAIFEQKVTGKEAYRAYAATVRHFHRRRRAGAGPAAGLLLPPDPAAVAATPYWVFHPFGVEQRRADTLCRAAAVAARLDECADAAEATRRLTAIPGIGAWTAAEVVRIAYGDADAVSVGDYHIPHMVAWALAGEAARGSGAVRTLARPGRRRGCWNCSSRSAATAAGSACCSELGGLGAPGSARGMPIRSFADVLTGGVQSRESKKVRLRGNGCYGETCDRAKRCRTPDARLGP